MVANQNLPDLDSLRPHLDIAPINTGVQRSLTPSGIVTDNIECLHAVTDEHGYIMLQSGVEFPLYAYRGQPEEHVPCVPKLGRLINTEDQLLALCRNAAFEDAIEENPYIRFCRQSTLLNRPLRVNLQGLAQHYGLATDLLDFTSNFDVACFFSVCYLDRETLEYRPVVDSEKTKPGVIYRIFSAPFVGTNLGAEFDIIGWQPLRRPEQQRAFGLIMKKGMDLNMLPFVEMIKFRHCAKISNRIWKSFDKGRALFPDDAAGKLAKKAETLFHFTRQQIERSWNRLDRWNEARTANDYRQAVEARSEIRLSETATLKWDGLAIEQDEGKLASRLGEVLNRVRCRKACYPE